MFSVPLRFLIWFSVPLRFLIWLSVPFMIFLIGSQSLYDFLNWYCWRKKIHCRKKIYSTPEIGLHGFLSWLNHTSKTELCILQHFQWNWQIFHFIISLNIFLSIKFKKIETNFEFWILQKWSITDTKFVDLCLFIYALIFL